MKFYNEEFLDTKLLDRIKRAGNFEEPDRVPIWDIIDNRSVLEYFAPGETDLLKANVKTYHGLGIDFCRGFGESFNENDEGKHIVDTVISGMTRWKIKYEISDIAELKNFEPKLQPEEWIRSVWASEIKRKQEAFAPYTMYLPSIGVGFHDTYDMMDLERFSYAIYENRDGLMKLMNKLNMNQIRYAKTIADEKLCEFCMIGDDIAYKNGLLFSPGFLRETFIPMLKNVCIPLKQAGIKVIFHSDGYIMEVLDDMISAGIDGLNPIEPLAGMDIGYLKKKYCGRLILVGNIDCSQLLPFGTKRRIVDATKECIRLASPGGGHFIGSSSEITPSTPLENILCLYETIHEYGKYPILL